MFVRFSQPMNTPKDDVIDLGPFASIRVTSFKPGDGDEWEWVEEATMKADGATIAVMTVGRPEVGDGVWAVEQNGKTRYFGDAVMFKD